MRNCIVVLNLANLTGSINHGIRLPNGEYQKIRIDYKAFLEYLVNGRYMLGAYVVSQQDTSTLSNKSEEQLIANQRFVQGLKKFGWTPLRVSYDSQTKDMTNIIDTVWQNVVSPLCDEDGNWEISTAVTDIVFVNGSVVWSELIQTFFNANFGVEVSYMKSATSKHLLANFAFDDITQFLLHNNVINTPAPIHTNAVTNNNVEV